MYRAKFLLQTQRLAGVRVVQVGFPMVQQNSTKSAPAIYDFAIRSFHNTPITLAKAKKGGKKGGDTDSDVVAELPDIKPTKQKMEQVVDRFTQEISKLKVGRASVDMFNDIMVGSYGSVANAGQVTVKSASSVNIAVYDPSMVKTVVDAIRDSGMGFDPISENSNVSVFIPKPSKESRDVLVKAASKAAEKSKLDVRQLRKNILDEVKKLKGSISEDEVKRFTKEVESTTEKNVDKISQLTNSKEKEILSS